MEIISLSSIGLGLFLLGMKNFIEGLDLLAYGRFKNIISNMKIHPLLGIIIGFVSTAILQSSSATTVILVGLVESNLLNLHQASSIIMGANVGTTMTSQLIAFNLSSYSFIPFLTSIIISLVSKNKKIRCLGEILIGFSLIFIGIDLLARGLSPLGTILGLQKILGEFGNRPVLGILLGFLTVAILQSSSTGVAILQGLANSGLISLQPAICIMLGMNIGTCVTTIIASLSHGRAAKQVALVHLTFNFLGVILIFPFISLLTRLSIYLSPLNLSRQVANAHMIFNLFTMLVLFPFINKFVDLIEFFTNS